MRLALRHALLVDVLESRLKLYVLGQWLELLLPNLPMTLAQKWSDAVDANG